MKNKVFSSLFMVFLILNITPASSMELGEFNKDTYNLKQYNRDKIENMGYLGKLKLLWKLPKIIKRARALLDEAEAENGVLEKEKVDEKNTARVMNNFFHKKVEHKLTQNITEDTVIAAPPNAIKDANNIRYDTEGGDLNLTIVESTLLFGNGSYDLKEGDIVQLYVENHFVYACFISQDTVNGFFSLRVPERQVNMTIEKFQDSFTGLKLKSSTGSVFLKTNAINKNQKQSYTNKINSGEKLISRALILEIVATVISGAGLIGSLLGFFYKFLKNPGSYAKLLGLLKNVLREIVKEAVKKILFVVSLILTILEFIGAIIYLIAVILRSVGEKKKENAEQDKDYLNNIIEHI